MYQMGSNLGGQLKRWWRAGNACAKRGILSFFSSPEQRWVCTKCTFSCVLSRVVLVPTHFPNCLVHWRKVKGLHGGGNVRLARGAAVSSMLAGAHSSHQLEECNGAIICLVCGSFAKSARGLARSRLGQECRRHLHPKAKDKLKRWASGLYPGKGDWPVQVNAADGRGLSPPGDLVVAQSDAE